MRARPHRRIRNSAGFVALLGLAVVASGCGASNTDKDDALRKELEAGAAKVTAAKSLRASTLIEVEENGSFEEIGCINLDIDGHQPESFDLTYFDLNCSGGSEAKELVVIGGRAWASSGPEGWSEAKIDPKLLRAVDEEQTDLKELFAEAEHIEAHREGEGTPYADTSYTFDAPASAFPSSAGDLEDADVYFQAVINRHGYLDDLSVHGDTGETGVTVTDSFEDFGQDLGIEPPDPSEVHGPVTTIRSRADLEELIGSF